MSDAPSAYIEKMLRAVVGVEITIDRIEGRLKLSQGENEQDRRGTVEGLQHSTDAPTQVLANLVLGELEEPTRRGLIIKACPLLGADSTSRCSPTLLRKGARSIGKHPRRLGRAVQWHCKTGGQ